MKFVCRPTFLPCVICFINIHNAVSNENCLYVLTVICLLHKFFVPKYVRLYRYQAVLNTDQMGFKVF